jgi:acylphosphatase
MTEKAAFHCIVTGRVQSVGYRNFVQAIARSLSLTGFVANLPDGSVEVLAQGEYGILKVFKNHLQTGPEGSQVSTIYDEWREEPSKSFEGFNTI